MKLAYLQCVAVKCIYERMHQYTGARANILQASEALLRPVRLLMSRTYSSYTVDDQTGKMIINRCEYSMHLLPDR